MSELGIDDKPRASRARRSARISHAKNRMEGPDALRGSWNPRDEQIAQIFERYQRGARREQRARLRRPAAARPSSCSNTSEQVRDCYADQFRYVHGRRVPGHQPPAVPADPPARRGPPQPVRRRRPRPVDLQVARRRPPQHPRLRAGLPRARIVRLEQNYRSTQIILDAASAVISQNRNRKDKRLWTDRAGGREDPLLPRRRRARGGRLHRARRAVGRAHDPATRRWPSSTAPTRSRASIEDALSREGVPYQIVGGVRFYERKEIKDALAYLKLVINPHDDVSLRRVINVPARGIGKGVMDALRRADAGGAAAAARGRAGRVVAATRSGRGWSARLDGGVFAGRAAASLRVFRDLIVGLADVARQEPVSVGDRQGARSDRLPGGLREERSEEAQEPRSRT